MGGAPTRARGASFFRRAQGRIPCTALLQRAPLPKSWHCQICSHCTTQRRLRPQKNKLIVKGKTGVFSNCTLRSPWYKQNAQLPKTIVGVLPMLGTNSDGRKWIARSRIYVPRHSSASVFTRRDVAQSFLEPGAIYAAKSCAKSKTSSIYPEASGE